MSVSAPLAYGGVSAQQAAPKVAVPVLYVAQRTTGSSGTPPGAGRGVDGAARTPRRWSPLDAIHGCPLVIEPGGDAKFRAAVFEFLANYAPPA